MAVDREGIPPYPIVNPEDIELLWELKERQEAERRQAEERRAAERRQAAERLADAINQGARRDTPSSTRPAQGSYEYPSQDAAERPYVVPPHSPSEPQPDQHPQQIPESTDASPTPSRQPAAPAAEVPKDSGRYEYQGDRLGSNRVDFVGPDPSPQPEAQQAQQKRRPVPPPPRSRRTPPSSSLDSTRQHKQGAPTPGNAARMRGDPVSPESPPRPAGQPQQPGNQSFQKSHNGPDTNRGQEPPARQRNLFDIMRAHPRESSIAAVCAGALAVVAVFGGHALLNNGGGESGSGVQTGTATLTSAQNRAMSSLPGNVGRQEQDFVKAVNNPATFVQVKIGGKKVTEKGDSGTIALAMAAESLSTGGLPGYGRAGYYPNENENGAGSFAITTAQRNKAIQALNNKLKAAQISSNDFSARTEALIAVWTINNDVAEQATKAGSTKSLSTQNDNTIVAVGNDLLAPEIKTYPHIDEVSYKELVESLESPDKPLVTVNDINKSKLAPSQMVHLRSMDILNSSQKAKLKKYGSNIPAGAISLTKKQFDSLSPKQIYVLGLPSRNAADMSYWLEHASLPLGPSYTLEDLYLQANQGS